MHWGFNILMLKRDLHLTIWEHYSSHLQFLEWTLTVILSMWWFLWLGLLNLHSTLLLGWLPVLQRLES